MKQATERIRLFKTVRDIPYRIAVGSEQDYCCSTKAAMLDKLLQTTGLRSRHIVCYFRWEDFDIPKDIIALPHEDPETHEYLEVWIPEKTAWAKVDATWDSRIRNMKIPIAEWDGLSDTKLAVSPLKTLSPENSTKFIDNETQDRDAYEAYMEKNREFFVALNGWLDSMRRPL
ncbi:MAG: hypothetical protein HYS81_04975 [Candidatus Aenigmatarchaeota archaeon]|nr:MAG: hypothetical protein HYS81_04975 [Candidatus Aenigmarchaeota archaeon]